jgi:hypothetical protein
VRVNLKILSVFLSIFLLIFIGGCIFLYTQLRSANSKNASMAEFRQGRGDIKDFIFDVKSGETKQNLAEAYNNLFKECLSVNQIEYVCEFKGRDKNSNDEVKFMFYESDQIHWAYYTQKLLTDDEKEVQDLKKYYEDRLNFYFDKSTQDDEVQDGAIIFSEKWRKDLGAYFLILEKPADDFFNVITGFSFSEY